MRLKVIDLDGSLLLQPQVLRDLEERDIAPIRAADLAPRLRFMAGRDALAALAARLGPARRGDLHFCGSGDFHHLTYLFLARLGQPVSVIHFDNHPDWTCLPRTLGCGSWVSRAVRDLDVAKVVTIGPCASDLACPQLKGADLPALRAGRQEVFPLVSLSTFYAGPAFARAGAQAPRGAGTDALAWRALEGAHWAARMEEIAAGLPDAALWISLDKDVLGAEEAVTNWDQGRLDLAKVLEAIAIFARHRPVIGMDVFGDYSPDRDNGPVRALLGWLDRDQRPAAPRQDPAPVNDRANARIRQTMEAILQ